MALSIFKDTFGSARKGKAKVTGGSATATFIVEVTDAVQSVVDTLRGPNGETYRVSLNDNVALNNASFTQKRINVSYKPVFDPSLKLATACTVMTGLVFHEVGHTLYTFPDEAHMSARFGPREGNRLAYTMLNIAEDGRLEQRMSARFPIARDVFPSTLHWLALRSGMVGNHLRWQGDDAPLTERVDFAVRSFRFPWTAIWAAAPATRAERLWWQDWGARYVATTDADMDTRFDLIDEACARLRNPEPGDPEPEPEPDTDDGDEPGEDGEGKDGEGESDEDQPPTSQPEGFDSDDDDDDADDVRDPWDEDLDDDADEGDEPGEDGDDEVEPGEDGDEETQPGDEPSDEDGEGEGEGNSTEDPDGEGKEASTDLGAHDSDSDDEDEDEDLSEVDCRNLKDGGIDTLNHLWDRNSSLLQQLVNEERAVERVGSGKYGTAKVEVKPLASRQQV